MLVDLHSMPPLKRAHPQDRVSQFVIGDRFGATADDRLVALALRELVSSGAVVAHNRLIRTEVIRPSEPNPWATVSD